MINLNDFVNNNNMNVLWEILTEQEETIGQSQDEFYKNAVIFYHHEKYKTNYLIEMNKKFIIEMIKFSKQQKQKQFNQQNQQNQNQVYKKIKIHEELKEPITYEEIQKEKKNKFDMELKERQNDFTNALSTPVPPIPNFKDNNNYDALPISELDKEIKRLQEQRKYDIDNMRHPNPEINNEWLKTIETKTEKINKHVTWSDKDEIDDNFNNDNIFFKKLKNKDSNEDNFSSIKNDIIYIKQKLYELEQNILYIEEKKI
jgi:hypothetical protein